MKRLQKAAFTVVITALVSVIVAVGFSREYAVTAPGLLDLKAAANDREIVVTGILLGSGGRITRTTTTRYGDVLLVRVYATAIEEDASPAIVRGTFAAVIPRDPRITSIVVGERSDTITIGRLYGLPIRIPRLPRRESAGSMVWPRNERELRNSTGRPT